MSQQNSKPEGKKRLFNALLTQEQLAAAAAHGTPVQVAYRAALEFLTQDSDHHIEQIEKHGTGHCMDITRGTLLAIEYWAHQITIMTLAVERARLLARIAEERKDGETLN